MNTLNNLFLIIHIVAGFTALTVGVVPMLAKKGGRLHILTGLVFYYAMAVVCASAFWLVAFKGSALFLLFIAIFSFYSTFSGRREILRKRLKVPSERTDYVAAALALAASVGMLGLGLYQVLKGTLSVPTVLYFVFGVFLFTQARYDWRRYLQPERSKYPVQSWFYHHITRMGGAYIAAFTAFVVVNARFGASPYAFWLSLAAWIGPGVVGGMVIGRTVRHYLLKMKVAKQS
ncbi:hypothetical protein GCM10027275_28020 [Rhabdobacter roseus]|uniref:Putative membrane protein n=1 Tax=Rhabdobacter roseus TaxID=1655419 RepID=A0A840TXX2_9BACT|nr:DUF2306 domain-containing protein [Rhabdobacter roseus]MBB5284750.1 putative membrane protein [Rhabdobacter roseus]